MLGYHAARKMTHPVSLSPGEYLPCAPTHSPRPGPPFVRPLLPPLKFATRHAALLFVHRLLSNLIISARQAGSSAAAPRSCRPSVQSRIVARRPREPFPVATARPGLRIAAPRLKTARLLRIDSGFPPSLAFVLPTPLLEEQPCGLHGQGLPPKERGEIPH